MKKTEPGQSPAKSSYPDSIATAEISGSDKYRIIIENSVHAFFLTEPDGTILETNKAASNIFGYTKEEFKKIKRQQILDHEDPRIHEALKKREKDGYVMTEATGIKKNGEYFPIEVSSAVFTNDEGKLNTSTMVTDLTEQVATKMTMQESENRLRTIVNSDPECIKIMDAEGYLLEMNPAGLAMIEAEHLEQVAGKKITDIVLPEYRNAFMQLHRDAYHGKPGKLQFIVRGLKGTLRYLETYAVPLKNTAGKISTVLGITRDITENKTAEALLLASEERYKYLFNNNPASIIIWDLHTLDIIEVNETAVELYGYDRSTFMKLKATDLQPPSEKDKFSELLRQAQNNEFTKKTMTWQQLNCRNCLIFVEISSHAIVYNGKKTVLALGKNVTENVLLENSLAEERQLRQQQITDAVITGQEKERSQLGEELHDNINQILATTRLYLDSALLAGSPPRLDFISESKLLLEKAMLEIRKLSKTLLPPSLGEIGLLDALTDLIQNFKGVNAIAIHTDWKNFPEDLLNEKIKLTLFRIVQEQLSNITRHASAANVTIRLAKTEDSVQLNIIDDGIGFNTDTKRTGVGIRNMISRAEVNNGTLLIESQPGSGCELRVNFLV